MTQQHPGSAPKPNLQVQAEHLLGSAFKGLERVRNKAGDLAHSNRSKLETMVGKAAGAIDERTGGKYSDTINKVKDQTAKGLDVIEGQRSPTGTPTPPPTTLTDPPTGAAGSSTATGEAEETPEPPAEQGWRRGPDGQWVRDTP